MRLNARNIKTNIIIFVYSFALETCGNTGCWGGGGGGGIIYGVVLVKYSKRYQFEEWFTIAL